MKPGVVLGSYEIVELIGAGGMGEVYRARDLRLGRDVALKLLPAAFAADASRLHRFEQEARATAALNDPNIVAIYDVGAHAGQPFVVSELLEGETLRQVLSGGPLPIRKVILYAQQIARGMAAAHRRGIVHRDLKPENVFLTGDGVIKILDFGLAKLREPNALDTSTHTTEPGILLGTVGYMSPEQARGEIADHRSDIFSFGIVLYEMIAGRKPFEGASAADTLSAILKDHPPELAQVVEGIPPGLQRITERCLEKKREDRFQSAADLGFALETLSGLSVMPPVSAPAERRRWAYIAIPLIAVAAIAAALLTTASLGTTDLPQFRQLTFRRGMVQGARFGPDGRTIVYAAAWEGQPTELFSTRPEAPEARTLQLPSTGLFALSANGEMAVVLSPSGFGRVEGTLGRASLAGGVPRQLANNALAADWSPDGTSLAAVVNESGRNLLQYPLGETRHEATPGYMTHIRFSPAGDAIAFLSHPVSGDTAGAVKLLTLPDNTVTTLSDGWNSVLGLGWSPDGNEVWFTGARTGASQALYAVSRSGKERLLFRAPATLTLHDVSRDGHVLVTRDAWGAGVMARSRGDDRERDLSWLDGTMAWDLSADGTTMVLEESWEGGGAARSIYLRSTDGAPAVRLGDGVPLALSPDKQWVVALPVAGDSLTLLPTGVGQQRQLPRGSITSYFPTAKWLPDGRSVLFSGAVAGGRSRIYLQSIEGGDPRAVSPEGVFGRIAVLANGREFVTRGVDRRLAIVSLDSGEVRPLAGAEPSDLPIVASADGAWLYVQSGDDLPAQVARVDLRAGRREVVRRLAPADRSGVTSVLRIVMTPDGETYAYTYVRAISALYLVEGVR